MSGAAAVFGAEGVGTAGADWLCAAEPGSSITAIKPLSSKLASLAED
jgi:hypothetical protein